MSFFDLVVEDDIEPTRLDKYVSSVPDGISRSRLKSGVLLVTVNGINAKFSRLVRKGDVIHVEWEDPIPENIEAEDIPLDIVYEDENVAVINKKQGMVTHPASGNWSGTVVNALLFHCNRKSFLYDKDDASSLRPGIVHRLDKDTSGLLITGKTKESVLYLQNEFASRRVKKTYIAIVKGKLPSKKGHIRTNLIRDPRDRKKFTWTDDPTRGKFSHTIYKCLATYGDYSVVALRLKTGRTHQIRVHMKSLGCPILGDPIYGKKDKLFESATLMLHSFRLGIRLPGEKKLTVFKAKVPIRFRKVLKKLKSLDV